jgi:GNAT superfamily N-acetyltransferase
VSALPDGVAIRTVLRRDLDAVTARCLALDADGWAVDARHAVPRDRAAFRREVEHLLFRRGRSDSLVAERGAEAIGVLVGDAGAPELGATEPPRGRVHLMWVDEAWRRRGVGRALVERFVGQCPSGRCDVSTLVADERAVAFWRAMGFRDLYVSLRR